MNERISFLRILFTSAIALLLTIVPLPQVLNYGRPDWLLLLIIYWSLNASMLVGLTYAWICGLILDALVGTLIGQHAMAFVVVTAVAQHFQLRIRVFPLLSQAWAVLLLLSLYHFLLFWIDGIVGAAVPSWMRCLPALVGALLWPLMVALLDTSNRRIR
jgi:rod shape-determining protein MreD